MLAGPPREPPQSSSVGDLPAFSALPLPTGTAEQPSLNSHSGHLLVPSTWVSSTASELSLLRLSLSQPANGSLLKPHEYPEGEVGRGVATGDCGLQPHYLHTVAVRATLVPPGKVRLGASHGTLDAQSTWVTLEAECLAGLRDRGRK